MEDEVAPSNEFIRTARVIALHPTTGTHKLLANTIHTCEITLSLHFSSAKYVLFFFIKFITLEKVLQSSDSLTVLRLTKVIHTCDMTLVPVTKNTEVNIFVAAL